VWALAQHGVPVALDGNVITLLFAPQWKVLHGKMTGDNQRALEAAASQALGAQVRIDPVLAEETEAAEAPPKVAEDNPGEDAPAVTVEEPEPADPVEQVKEAFPGSTVMGEREGSPG